MIFSSTVFLSKFLPIVLLGSFILRKKIKWQNLFLLLMSLMFYAWGEPKYVLLMLLSIVGNYALAILIERTAHRRFWLFTAVSLNIGMLFVCKYLNWGIGILNRIFDTSWQGIKMTLPIGISFYTFQALSYVIDVYRNTVPVQRNLINVGLYVSLFPQLVAGPIVRYVDIEKQIMHRTMTVETFAMGIERFMIGFSKKILLADSFSVIADHAFAMNLEGTLGIAMAWLGAIAYTLQIYYDFGGYSDMAIGLGKMLGFSFAENFNHPYMALSVTDFWRRWHISLSRWFRDYVYIPLGGNQQGKKKMILALAMTWIATGIWHGANRTFVLWGGVYGILIIIEKLWKIPDKLKDKTLSGIFYRVFTLVIVILLWVIFRAENLAAAFRYLAAMFRFDMQSPGLDTWLLYLGEYRWELLAGVLFCFPIGRYLKESKYKWVTAAALAAEFICFLIGISYLMKGTYSPFIYFNF